MPADTDLEQRAAVALDELADAAEVGGKPAAWIAERVEAVFAALVDPRVRRSLDEAEKVARAKGDGPVDDALARRFGRSKSQLRRLLAARASHHARLTCFTRRDSTVAEVAQEPPE